MRQKSLVSFSVVMLMTLGMALTACGDTATTAPAATTAAAKTAATTAAVTTAATTAAATTAAATTARPATTVAATTAAATTAAATTARPATTAAATTTPAKTGPTQTNTIPLDPMEKADPELVAIFSKYSKATGSADQKLKAASDYATMIEAIDDSHELYFEVTLSKGANQQPVVERLTNMGATVHDVADEGTIKVALVTVPLDKFIAYSAPATKDNFLRYLATLKEVSEINLPKAEETKELNHMPQTLDAMIALAEASKNQGVKIMGVDKWQAAGINGKGVTVGIIDSGYKFIDQLKGQNYLPADFAVMDFAQKLLNESSIEGGVHGTAVAEIIYSLAPGSKIVATSIKGTEAEFSEAIDFLVSQKVDLISISMGNNSSAEDGNSALSKKVEQVRKEKGILFFLASGNEGTEHYAGKISLDANGYHQWQPGITKMAIGNPTDNPLQSNVILRWDQFLEGTVNPNATDLDLIIEDAKGAVLITIDADQRARSPHEIASLNIPPKTILYLRARLKPGTAAPANPFNVHVFITGGLSPQILTPTQSVGSQADSRGAIAVGAVDPPEGTAIGSYSSQGPLSDGRIKPEISGPAGVDSAAYQAKGGGNGKFPGTSAATPNVSGMATIIKSSNPALTPDEWTQAIFEATVKPAGVTTQGIDPVFGYGMATLANTPPGPIKPKGTLQTPATNPNPEFKYSNPSYLPTPAADAPASGGTAPAAPAAVQLAKLEVDESISKAGAATFKQGTLIGTAFYISPNDGAAIVANQEAIFLARGYKFALPGNTKPLTTPQGTVAIYTKDGEPDIYLNAVTLPDDPTSLLTPLLGGVSPDVLGKFIGQVKGQKTLLSVALGTDLLKNFGS